MRTEDDLRQSDERRTMADNWLAAIGLRAAGAETMQGRYAASHGRLPACTVTGDRVDTGKTKTPRSEDRGVMSCGGMAHGRGV